jgi:hypothetical protein
MVSGPNQGLASRNQSLAGLERDAALIRVSRTRRALFVGAAALSAGLAVVVSAVAPGRSLGAKPTFRAAVPTAATTASVTGASSTQSRPVRMPPLASPGELGLQAPNAAPQSAPSQSSAASPNQSGGSSGSGSTSPQAAPAPTQQQAAPSPASAASAPAPSPAPSGGVVSGGS